MNGTRIGYLALLVCLAPAASVRAQTPAAAPTTTPQTQAAEHTPAHAPAQPASSPSADQREPDAGALRLGPDEAVRQAIARHQDLEAAGARVASAEGLRRQAALRPNPRLTFQVENLRGDRSAPFSYERDADTFLYGSQVFETAGKRGKRAQYFLADAQTRSHQRDQLAADIAARVSHAYWAAAGATRERAVLDASRENFDRIVQYHRDRVNEGAMAEADLLRVQLEQDRLAVAVATAAQQADQARQQLVREMGIADPGPIALTGDLERRPSLPPLDEDAAVARRADIMATRQARTQAEAFVTLQRANGTPDPDVLVGYKRTAGFNTVMAGVQIDLPFSNRMQGAVAAAQADARAADATARAAELRARNDIARARAAYESRARVIEETLPRMRARATEISRIADAAYREGGTDLLRLLDAQRASLDADLLYFRTLTEFQQAVIDLQFALGVLR